MDQNLEQVEKIGIDAFVYAIYAALIPFNMIMNFSGTGTINRYIGIIAAALIAFMVLLKNKRNVKMPKPASVLVVLTIWCMFSVLWSVYQVRSWSLFITFISSVALCLLCVARRFNQRELRLIKFFIVIPSAILVFYLSPNQDVSWSRGTLTSSAGHADQNSLAANLVFAFWIAMDLLRTTEKRSAKILYIASIVSILVGLLFIASRGAMVALVISLLVYLFAIKKVKLKFTAVVTTVLVCVIIYFIVTGLGITSIERLSLDSLYEDGGTGRFYIWEQLFDYMADDGVMRVFGGYGFGSELIIARMAVGKWVGIHNTYLEYLFTTGLIGLVLLFWFLFSVFKVAKKNKDGIGMVLWVSLVVICFPLGFFLNKGAWNVLMLIMTGLAVKSNKGVDGEALEAHENQ